MTEYQLLCDCKFCSGGYVLWDELAGKSSGNNSYVIDSGLDLINDHLIRALRLLQPVFQH